MPETKRRSTGASGPAQMIAMLVVAVFFSMAARAIYSPLMPYLQAELGLTLALAGTLFLLVSVSYAAAMLFSGFLAARVGHGRTIVVSLATISAGLLLSAAAPGAAAVACGMILIGAGAGAYPPSGMAMISTRIAIEKRATAFAVHEIGPNLALLMSPLLVLIFEPWLGWRGVLLLTGAVCGLAALVFARWGTAGSGTGSIPDLRTIGAILRLPHTYVGMFVLSAAIGAMQGVYAILPAYLVERGAGTSEYANALLTVSRIMSIVFLLGAGALTRKLGKRRVIISVLLFTGLCTGLIGLVESVPLAVAVIAQPAFLALIFPPLLAAMADLGESSYRNVTYAVIITVGIGVGAGAVPALLGMLGDLGFGWLGFVALAVFMGAAAGLVTASPRFGKE